MMDAEIVEFEGMITSLETDFMRDGTKYVSGLRIMIYGAKDSVQELSLQILDIFSSTDKYKITIEKA